MPRKLIFYHLGFWILYVALNVYINKMQVRPQNFYWQEQTLKVVVPILIAYATAFFILPLTKNNRLSLILLLAASLTIYYFLRYFILHILLPRVSGYPNPQSLEGKHFFAAGFWWWFHYTVYGWVYWYYFKAIDTEKELRKTQETNFLLERKNMETEQAKLQAEYNHLKAQINPHFLFNTLGLIYKEVTPHSRQAGQAVEALSDMMRYTLHQPATADGLAALEDEAAHIDNYLTLLQMRYGGRLHIQYTRQGPLAGWRLPPHLLITLVENAYKHGELNNAAHPLQITLQATAGQLLFEVRNKTGGVKCQGSGIGLPYIQQRLQAQYGAGHHFTYGEHNGFFTARLHITANATVPAPATLPQPLN